MELSGQNVSASSEESGAEMHIGDLKDLESAVVAEPQGKLRPFLEANWAVVNDQISVNKVEDGEDEGEIEQMVFPFHSYRFRFHSMYATV